MRASTNTALTSPVKILLLILHRPTSPLAVFHKHLRSQTSPRMSAATMPSKIGDKTVEACWRPNEATLAFLSRQPALHALLTQPSSMQVGSNCDLTTVAIRIPRLLARDRQLDLAVILHSLGAKKWSCDVHSTAHSGLVHHLGLKIPALCTETMVAQLPEEYQNCYIGRIVERTINGKKIRGEVSYPFSLCSDGRNC